MTQILKGKVTIDGVSVEIEAGTPSELASVLQSVLSVGKKSQTPVAKPVDTPSSPSAYSVKPNVRKNKSSGMPRKGYHWWTKNDVLTVARLAIEHGEKQDGFSKRVSRYLRGHGEVRSRSDVNMQIFGNRIHRYLYKGRTLKMNKSTLKMLNENGFVPFPSVSEPSRIPVEA